MYLTNDQERMLKGEYGIAIAESMNIIVKIGELYNADKLLKITSAQVSGISYKTIGEAGIKYLKHVSENAKVSVPTTLNPAGMDIEHWEKMKIIDDNFRSKQLEIVELYKKMGIKQSYTCTPYLGDNIPSFGDHIAWAESSAVIYANSIIGARTNREGGPLALASAITGYTSNYGMHIEENRKATIVFEIDRKIKDYSLLGAYIGDYAQEGIPYLIFNNVTKYLLKNLGAPMATWGSIAMYHIEGVTPEYKKNNLNGLERVKIDEKNLNEFLKKKIGNEGSPELIAFGCPLLSAREIKNLCKIITAKPKKSTSPEVWICTSRFMASKAKKEIAKLEKWGAKVLLDTCMVVSPIENLYGSTAVNSAKASYYLPKKSFSNQKIIYNTDKEIVEKYL
ncbi:MAG: aconitase X catalytic domain-containing protein [Thermoplasmata archaeon]